MKKPETQMSPNTLEFTLGEIAGRIRELREIEGYSIEEIAEKCGITPAEYEKCEAGAVNLTFAFLYRCANALKVDVTALIEGSSPKLSSFTLTRRGEGQRIEEAHSMIYYNLAAHFKNRIADPLFVKARYDESLQNRPIDVTTHEGHECDIVISGQLKVQIGTHTEILTAGDSIYYDSSTPHGLLAVGGEDCEFYAIVLNPAGETNYTHSKPVEKVEPIIAPDRTYGPRIYHKFVDKIEDDNGSLISCKFKNTDAFNFGFDIIDGLAALKPDKLAMIHLDHNKTERRFTFSDISRYSSMAANYFKSLGIKKGDRVMLVLKRSYQFWFAIVGLHKLGAIAIPGTDQLLAHDLEYRFQAAGVKAVVCTANSDVSTHVDAVCGNCPELEIKIIAGGERDGWRCFDSDIENFSDVYPREADAPCGEDPMLMFFTSGTTGFPKMALHNYKYPLGHFITAKYWHCVIPEGIHFTISDTGWAKAAWGKIYGQWICEAGMFAYDFDRFDPDDILPLFSKYNITTFCAPPTMYRFMIKQDLSKYDLSSVKHATTAGEALNPEVFYQFKKATGLSIMDGFGQSETTLCIGNLTGTTPKVGSMGRPLPIYDVELLDADGDIVPDGETGEICIRTSIEHTCGLFVGYYRDEEKTAEVWHDGFYHTGDTAWRDEDGYLWYVGRTDDVIKSSGYRIGPFEIESVIMELPYVLECGVSAAPDPVRGQVVKASIVLIDGTEGTEELKQEIQAYVKEHTAPYKYPRIVVFRDELPKTVSGKIKRNQL